MRYVEAVFNREGIEHRADVLHIEDGLSCVQIDYNSVIRDLRGPDD